MYVCICNAVTDREIRRTVALGACTLADVSAALGVATCCGKCRDHAREVIDAAVAEQCAAAGERPAEPALQQS